MSIVDRLNKFQTPSARQSHRHYWHNVKTSTDRISVSVCVNKALIFVHWPMEMHGGRNMTLSGWKAMTMNKPDIRQSECKILARSHYIALNSTKLRIKWILESLCRHIVYVHDWLAVHAEDLSDPPPWYQPTGAHCLLLRRLCYTYCCYRSGKSWSKIRYIDTKVQVTLTWTS